MLDEISPDYIKSVRRKYGLTQKAFARVLGIGDASIVRYEQGKGISKAMANLIRAADMPQFMAECLERDGDSIPEAQKEKAEKVVYSLMSLDEKGDVMDINQIYELTLQQEILNEKAALLIADISRDLDKAREENDTITIAVLEDVWWQICEAKGRITDSESRNFVRLAEVRGQILGLESIYRRRKLKVA